MRRTLSRLLVLLAASFALAAPAAATCGGGGGGGLGGVPSGGGAQGPGAEAFSYQVPWKVLTGDTRPAAGSLLVYWFPTSPEQARRSSLQTSRALTEWSGRCIAMTLVPAEEKPLHTQYNVTGEAVVVVDREGKEIGRVPGSDKWIYNSDVEKLLGGVIKKHEGDLDGQLDAAKAKEKAGDADGAAAIYNTVLADRCFAPGPAKKAAKGLKKLGKPVPDEVSRMLEWPEPNLAEPVNSRTIAALNAGLAAEREDRYEAARQHYLEARRLDPGDFVVLRYLGELYRHHTGEWTEARKIYEEVLARPADPMTRAVALHGLGKMTIHEGDSAKGLGLFELSVATYPLALTYRNLAVFWNSEGLREKAKEYVQLARSIDPEEPFNRIFVATYLVEDGKVEEALRIARENEGMMAASYNLAAIYNMAGNQEKALQLLQRHFYQYERYDPVRAHEMKEAREDVVFKSLHADPKFVELTAKALPYQHNMRVGEAASAKPKAKGGTR